MLGKACGWEGWYINSEHEILFWELVLLWRENGCEWTRMRRFVFRENAFKAGLTSTNRGINGVSI
jgi:hypothetical protein